MESFKSETIYFENPLFTVIDVLYIINTTYINTLMINTIKHLKLTKRCNIIYRNNSNLLDVKLFIMKDAKKNHTKNIMILEDNSIFSDDIKSHVENIESFIKKKQNEKLLYFIGCLPIISSYYDNYNYKLWLNIGTYCIICNDLFYNDFLEYYLELFNKNKNNCILFYNMSKSYMYHIPLCYKLFKHFDTTNLHMYNLLQHVFSIVNLDNSIFPGFTIFYFFSKYIIYIFLFLVVIFICLFRKYIFW